VKYIVFTVFQNENSNVKLLLAKTLQTCFVDWKYPNILGEELIRQIASLFEEWLFNCPSNLLPDEIIVIRNLTAVCSQVDSIKRRRVLTSSWIWHTLALPNSINNVVNLIQEFLVGQSPNILFAGSSAFKTYLGSQNREALESGLISLLDVLICIPSDQIPSVMNMWNYGVLNILHSLLYYPKYSVKHDEILGWSRDEGVCLAKEIIWNSSSLNSFSGKVMFLH
jgi:hypothetical protein